MLDNHEQYSPEELWDRFIGVTINTSDADPALIAANVLSWTRDDTCYHDRISYETAMGIIDTLINHYC